MRLATVRTDEGTHAAVIEGERAGLLDAPDVRSMLENDAPFPPPVVGWGLWDEAELAPLVPDPRKIICLGLNYATHIQEMGRDLPAHPTLFAKFARALVGARDPIVLPQGSTKMDWEAELALVIGSRVRRASPDAARDAIAGYTIMNDVSERDWQWRTTQWLQGKTFESTTPLGPVMVTPDELDGRIDLRIRCWVNDELMQDARTGDLVFDPVTIVAYVSQILTLEPGDIIATGTPGGVGAARDPQRFLQPGDVLRTRIEGIGELVNQCAWEEP